MDELISLKGKHRTHAKSQQGKAGDPFEELERYLEEDLVPRDQCRDVVSHWGVNPLDFNSERYSYI